MKILVHAPNWVGDHAMAFPFYAALHSVFPAAELTLMGRGWVSDLAPASFSEIVSFQGKSLTKADFSRIKSKNFDLAFTLSPSFRSAWLLKRLGVPKRHGFRSDMRGLLLTKPANKFRKAPYNRYEHRALAYIRLLVPYLPPQLLPEDLFQKFRNVQLAPQPLEPIEKKYALPKSAARIVICPGSTAPAKKYPVGHLIQAITEIAAKKPNLQVLLLGAKMDLPECDAIARHFTQAKNHKPAIFPLCGKTSLSEAHALIASARLTVANDSGLAHMTSLTHTPLVTFNGMGRREETAPLTPQKTLFDLGLSCSPCFAKVCPRKDQPLACLEGIAPQAVSAAAFAFLKTKTR